MKSYDNELVELSRYLIPEAEAVRSRAWRAPRAGDLAPLHALQVEDVHVGEEDCAPVLREAQSPEGVDLAARALAGPSGRGVDCRVASSGARPGRGGAAEAANAHGAGGGHGEEESVRLHRLGSVSSVEKKNLRNSITGSCI